LPEIKTVTNATYFEGYITLNKGKNLNLLIAYFTSADHWLAVKIRRCTKL